MKEKKIVKKSVKPVVEKANYIAPLKAAKKTSVKTKENFIINKTKKQESSSSSDSSDPYA